MLNNSCGEIFLIGDEENRENRIVKTVINTMSKRYHFAVLLFKNPYNIRAFDTSFIIPTRLN